MGKFKLLVVAAITMAMSIGLGGMAFAANQGSCGWCHGVMTNSATALGNGKNQLTDTRDNTTAPTYESSLLPQADNGRGLHGIHMNYSSAHYAGGTQKISRTDPANPYRTKLSAYIDAGAPGAIQYPAGSPLSNNTALVAARGNCGYCHAASHPNHESGFLQWSTTSVKTGVYQITTKGYMLYTSAGRGVSYKNNISSMDGPRTGNCTQACHKGTSNANPAPWGNYTTAAIKLTCNSCHADSSGVSGTEAALTGAHAAHLSSGITVPSGVLMSAANNAGCVNCHPNNTGEGKTAKDWGPRLGAKAYPHATDGTEVSSDNAVLSGQITSATKAGTSTTCAAACHPRSNAIASPITWGGSMDCNMCHYYEATPSSTGNNAVTTGQLTGSHGAHFDQGKTCSNCHVVPTSISNHNIVALPANDANVTVTLAQGTWNAGTQTCTNTGAGCHLTGSVVWGSTLTCASCHEYPNSANDWNTATNVNGHTVRATVDQATNPNAASALKHLNVATAYNPASDTYAGVTGNQTKCGKCHSGGTHQNGTIDVNAGTGAAAGFTLTNHTQGSSAQCSNAKCHFNRTTPNWY